MHRLLHYYIVLIFYYYLLEKGACMTFFIKNLGIIICCIYYYIRLLHININRKFYIFFSILAILLSFISIYLDLHFPYLTMLFIIFFIAVFLRFITKTLLSVSITTTAISFAFSYVTFIISTTIISGLVLSFYGKQFHIFTQLLCCILQLILMKIPFLFKPLYAIPGMIISLLILFMSIIINHTNYDILYIILFILIQATAILIYLYWKNNLTKTYMDKLNERNLTDLNNVLSEKLEYINQLEQENKELAKIIHKDNKLIPAMELAVKTYISASEDKNTDMLATGKHLLEELASLSEERREILFHQDIQCRKLTSTNVLSIDTLFTYMQQKALEYDITFNVSISCDVSYFIEHIIEEKTLNTLLADLLENAIIATRCNNGHHILLSIGIVSNAYSINIFDSGIPFTKEVLIKWGLEQITTHQDDSGSSIGLMTSYEIIKEKNASFIINEFSSDGGLYTKEVSVLFNNLSQYTLHTSRTEEEIAYLNQRADLLVIPK